MKASVTCCVLLFGLVDCVGTDYIADAPTGGPPADSGLSDSTDVTVVVDTSASAPARAGAFVGRDDSHENTGSATLGPGGDGVFALTFSADFFVTAGPGLEVFLTPSDGVGPGSLGLGTLQTTRGAQTYTLSADATVGEYNWVLIHCVPFNITFGKARLQ